MTNTTLAFRSEWRWLLDRYSGFTLIDASADWLRGEWFMATVALLGFRLTYTRWLVVPVESLGRERDDGEVIGREKAP